MTKINNFDTWIALQQLVNVQQNGQIPPSVFMSWYNDVSDWYMKYLVDKYQTNQVLSDLLSPYIQVVNVLVSQQTSDNWGIAIYPSNYQYFLTAAILRQKEEKKCLIKEEYPIIDSAGKTRKYTDPDLAQMIVNYTTMNVEERQLQLIDTQRWASCLNHITKGPTFDAPKMTQFQGGFRVAPKGINNLLLTYVDTPVRSVLDYTISADDIAIYNDAGSTQLKWSNQVSPVFLAKLVSKYASYINSEYYAKMGESMLATALAV